VILVGPISGSLSDRQGARGLSTAGLLVAAGGFFYLSEFTTTTTYPEIALGLILVGIGIGLFRSPNASSVMGSVPTAKRGISSGVRSTIINTSIVASIPLVLAVMTADIPYNILVNIVGNVTTVTSGQIIGGYATSFLTGLRHALAIFSALILVSAIFSFLRGSRPDPVAR